MKLLNFFKKFYVIYILFVIFALVFVAPFLGYTFKRNYAIGNMIHIIVTLSASILLIYFTNKFKQKSKKLYPYINTTKGFWVTISIMGIILLILQFFICNGAWFIFGWDTRNVIFPDMQMDSDYMSMYPNQIFLAGVFRSFYDFFKFVNIYDFSTYYYCLVTFASLCVFISIILITAISKKLTTNFCGLITFLLASFFLGLSPWIMVPYSDNLSMIMTCLCLFIYVCVNKPYVKWPLITFFALIGYEIKPTAIFILFSIIFVEIVMLISKSIKQRKININKKRIINSLCSVILVCLSIFIVCKYSDYVKDYGVEINEEDNFSATHFLMMGINSENQGGWNIDDTNFSRSFETVESRENGNITEWLTRLKTNGLAGNIWILFNKTLTNYGDGAFAWEAEKPWCIENKGDSPLIWNIYGIDPSYQHNDNNNYFAYVWQWIWLMILVGCPLIIYNKKFSKYESVIILTLLAISGFLTICEPDPRYIMLYIPYMIILSTWGYMNFSKKYSCKIDRASQKINNKFIKKQ